MHGDPQQQGQPGAGAPGQLQPEPGQHRRQRHAAPAVTAGHALGLLSERDRRALRPQAAEPAYLQGDQHRAAAGRAAGHHPRIPAMHPGGLLPAPRAHAGSARHDAEITTASPASATWCIRSLVRCGNNMAARASCPGISQAPAAVAVPAGGRAD